MKVKIGAFDYDLQEVPSTSDSEGYECFGTQSFSKATIRIVESLGQPLKLNTYIHELFEALNRVYGLDMSHSQIISIAGTLAQVLQENPELTNRLIGLCPKEDKK